MYCNFFKFSEKPFDVTPDPKFLYLTPGHQETLASLMYGIRERRGFITIVGEVGTGKTTLLNTVLDRLDENTKVAYIFNSNATFKQMLNMALVDLGVMAPEKSLTKIEAVSRLNDFAIQQLAINVNVVLIVDEAQNLDNRSMENLRLLSNLETHKYKLVQIVLSGQPELDAKLSQPELRQLMQRISLRRYIKPLSEKETYEYIQHRLSIANYKGPSVFSRRAKQLIWEYSKGVPRKINILCDNAFLIGYGLKKRTINAGVMEEAIKDLTWSPFSGSIETPNAIAVEERAPGLKKRTSHLRFALAPSLVLVACLIFAIKLFVGESRLNLREVKLFSSKSEVPAKIASQHDSSEQSPASARVEGHAQARMTQQVALTSVLQEKGETGDGSIGEYYHEQQKSAKLSVQTEKEELPIIPKASSDSEDGQKTLTERQRFVVAKKGDSLSEIIMQGYRKYDEKLLITVIRENPEILSPDRIFVGQAIKLPELDLRQETKINKK
jgi:general secretion pathway protein A